MDKLSNRDDSGASGFEVLDEFLTYFDATNDNQYQLTTGFFFQSIIEARFQFKPIGPCLRCKCRNSTSICGVPSGLESTCCGTIIFIIAKNRGCWIKRQK